MNLLLAATLVIATNSGQTPPRLADLLRRQLPELNVENTSAMELYKKDPTLPTPVCASAAYYLFGATGQLMRVGCVNVHGALDGMSELLGAVR